MADPQKTTRYINLDGKPIAYYSLPALAEEKRIDLASLPFSIRLLLEMLLRQCGEGKPSEGDLAKLSGWAPGKKELGTIAIFPQRVVMQDLTGVPVLNDLASLRAAVARAGGDPARVNPLIPLDLVVDHSVQVDYTGIPEAFQKNLELEFQRNRERYQFLHWAQQAFQHFRLIPPGTGIVHQVNLEALSPVVWLQENEGLPMAIPDMVIGTDSHTPMINGLGVLGWGVGGIEAIAALLGNPLELPIPEVVGVRLTGSLPQGTTPTDLTLTIVQKLRALGVVDKFIEFTGPALEKLGVPERAMIANMAPEYGATTSYFPVDQKTLDYLRLTGREESTVHLVESYFRAQGLLHSSDSPEPYFSQILEVSLDLIVPSIAGPKKPENRVALSDAKQDFLSKLGKPVLEGGYGLNQEKIEETISVELDGKKVELPQGAVVLAAITSCTNTSDPYVMIAAGLLARNALARGMRLPVMSRRAFRRARGWFLIISPGRSAGKTGDSGVHPGRVWLHDLHREFRSFDPAISQALDESKLVAAAVLSGNRNFEGRVQPLVRANYLASPPLVVAYALAGRMDIDLTHDPLGMDEMGKPVTLDQLWPGEAEIHALTAEFVNEEAFHRNRLAGQTGSREWQALKGGEGLVYDWDPSSDYLKEPPFADPPRMWIGTREFTTRVPWRYLATGSPPITSPRLARSSLPARRGATCKAGEFNLRISILMDPGGVMTR